MKRVVLFGATGTLGAYTVDDLVEKGYEVIPVSCRESDNGFFAEMGLNYHSVDIARSEEFNSLPTSGVDAVIHFAGAMPSTMHGYDPFVYVDSIVRGTLNVLNYAKKVGADRVVFTHTRADSSHLMGSTDPVPADMQRSYPLKGDHSVYTICKNAAVNLIEHYYHEYGLKRFVLRLPTIYAYSPDPYFYVNGKRRMMAYRQIIEQAMRSEPVEIWGDPNKKKEIVYVKDFTQIGEGCLTAGVDGGIYNVGRGEGTTLEEQVRGIVEVFSPPGNPSPITYRPEKSDGRQFVHDISKTTRELGYQPKYGYRDLLEDLKKEMEANRFARIWGEPISLEVEVE